MRPLSFVTRWGVAAVIAVLIATLATGLFSGGAMFSPGALRAAGDSAFALRGVRGHAELSSRCGACHAPFWDRGGMAARCRQCHTDIQAELQDTTTLHGSFDDGARCRACHTEHHGPRGLLTRVGGAGFDHARLGFSLAAHRRTAAGNPFTCGDCHGPGSYLVPAESCASCHREVDARFTAAHVHDWGEDCMACHDGVDRFTGFRHDSTSFRLGGAHADAACASCHTGVTAVAAFSRAPSECVGCHRDDDEHRGTFGSDCASCHADTRWSDVRFDHSFPLTHGSRQPSRCAVCHEGAPREYRSYTCYGCHEHTPAGIRAEHLEEGISNFTDCMRCHPTGREEEGEGRGGREHGEEH